MQKSALPHIPLRSLSHHFLPLRLLAPIFYVIRFASAPLPQMRQEELPVIRIHGGPEYILPLRLPDYVQEIIRLLLQVHTDVLSPPPLLLLNLLLLMLLRPHLTLIVLVNVPG